MYLSLQGNAREAVRITDPKDLATENGHEKVIEALEKRNQANAKVLGVMLSLLSKCYKGVNITVLV